LEKKKIRRGGERGKGSLVFNLIKDRGDAIWLSMMGKRLPEKAEVVTILLGRTCQTCAHLATHLLNTLAVFSQVRDR
jgi:hypothetical protein